MKVWNSPRLRLTAVLAGAALCLLAAGCTSAPRRRPGQPVGRRLQCSGDSRDVGLVQRVPSTEPTGGLTIDITIADGKVDPNGKKIDVAVGTTVVFKVSSDIDDEIHAHTGGDGYELEVKAGEPIAGAFTVDQPGQLRGRVASSGQDHRDLECPLVGAGRRC